MLMDPEKGFLGYGCEGLRLGRGGGMLMLSGKPARRPFGLRRLGKPTLHSQQPLTFHYSNLVCCKDAYAGVGKFSEMEPCC